MEAIKMAVQVGLGAAFVSRAAVQKELQLGLLAAVDIEVHEPHVKLWACLWQHLQPTAMRWSAEIALRCFQSSRIWNQI